MREVQPHPRNELYLRMHEIRGPMKKPRRKPKRRHPNPPPPPGFTLPEPHPLERLFLALAVHALNFRPGNGTNGNR